MGIRTQSLLAGALAVVTACGTPADTETAPARDTGPEPSVSVVGDTTLLELPMGRSASNGDITVTFEAVTTDSRCPTDVQCVWAGNAGIRLTLEAPDERDVVVVNSAMEPQWVGFLSYAIGFRDLAPHPTSTQPPDAAGYVATVAILDRSDYTPAPRSTPPPGSATPSDDAPARTFID